MEFRFIRYSSKVNKISPQNQLLTITIFIHHLSQAISGQLFYLSFFTLSSYLFQTVPPLSVE